MRCSRERVQCERAKDEEDSTTRGIGKKRCGVWLRSSVPLRVQLLQGPHIHFTPLQCRNPFGGGAGGGERRDRRNPGSHGSAANGLFIEERIRTFGRVHD